MKLTYQKPYLLYAVYHTYSLTRQGLFSPPKVSQKSRSIIDDTSHIFYYFGGKYSHLTLNSDGSVKTPELNREAVRRLYRNKIYEMLSWIRKRKCVLVWFSLLFSCALKNSVSPCFIEILFAHYFMPLMVYNV